MNTANNVIEVEVIDGFPSLVTGVRRKFAIVILIVLVSTTWLASVYSSMSILLGVCK